MKKCVRIDLCFIERGRTPKISKNLEFETQTSIENDTIEKN